MGSGLWEEKSFTVWKPQSLLLCLSVRLQATRSSTALKRQKIKVEKQMLMPPTLLPTCWAQEVQSLQTREEKASPAPITRAPCCFIDPHPGPSIHVTFQNDSGLRHAWTNKAPRGLSVPNRPLTLGSLCVSGVNCSGSLSHLFRTCLQGVVGREKGWKVHILQTAEELCCSVLCVFRQPTPVFWLSAFYF